MINYSFGVQSNNWLYSIERISEESEKQGITITNRRSVFCLTFLLSLMEYIVLIW